MTWLKTIKATIGAAAMVVQISRGSLILTCLTVLALYASHVIRVPAILYQISPPTGVTVSFIKQELGGAASVKRACVLDGSVKSSRL